MVAWLDFLSFVVFLDEKFLLNPGWICKYLPAQITLPSHCYAEFLLLQIVLRAIFSSVCCSNVLLIAWTLLKGLHLARFKLAAFKGSGRWQIKMSFAFPETLRKCLTSALSSTFRCVFWTVVREGRTRPSPSLMLEWKKLFVLVALMKRCS